MSNDPNQIRKPFLVVLLSFVLLGAYSLTDQHAIRQLFGLRKTDIFSEIRPAASRKPARKMVATTYKTDSIGKPVQHEDDDTLVANSEVRKLIRTDVKLEMADTLPNEGLNHFLQALYELKQGRRRKVRIGYFGDSMIEGDLISQDLRKILQDSFGGNGIGFVPVTSVVAPFRQTVKQEFSDNWKDVNYMTGRNAKGFGISGHVFYPSAASTVRITGSNIRHLLRLPNVDMLVGKCDSSLSVSYGGKKHALVADNAFNLYSLIKDSVIKTVDLSISGSSKTPVFGFAIEGDEGVYLDNFSFRGSSGTELMRLSKTMLQQMDSLRPYDLIVLHYGPNLLYDVKITDFSWYEQQMGKTLRYLKRVFPESSFLIISSADKALKTEAGNETAPGVEPLVQTQHRLAEQYQCAFFNLYEAMGGYNSMVTWADKKPILAGKDYTHFNASGSAKIGRMITRAIMEKYKEHAEKN